MNINIVYSGVYNKLTEKELLTSKTANKIIVFIKMLEDDKQFENMIVEARNKLGIDSNKFEDLPPDKDRSITVDDFNLAWDICNEYQISMDAWTLSIVDFIRYNKLPFPRITEEIEIFNGDELYKKAEKLWDYLDDTVFIVIRNPIKKTRLVELVETSYNKIAKILTELEHRDVPSINIRNIKIYKSIYRQRNDSKYPFTEISSLINDEYGVAFGDNEIRIMYKRYVDAISNLHNNKP